MNRLDCNLALQSRPRTGQRWLVGSLVVIFLGMLTWREVLLDRISLRQQNLGRLHARTEHAGRLAGASQPQAPSAEVVSELNAVATELTRPWETSLDSLQKTAEGLVTLDRIQPDPATNRFSIRGRAETMDAYLQFMQRLQKSPDWRNIQPVSDEADSIQTSTGLAIRFELAGQWSGT